VALGAASLIGLAWVLVPSLASAGTDRVAPPHGLHVVQVSSSSFTVAGKQSSGANRYRLFASTNKRDLFVSNIESAKRSGLSSTPLLSLRGLHYTSTPYYYRVEAMNGSRRRFSAVIGSVGLRPATPTHVSASSSSEGTSLHWQSGAATGYSIVQATDPTMTQNRTVYTITGPDRQFTPYHLVPGTTYYFQVRALNASTPSPATAPVATTATASEQPVKVMTYNVLEAFNDGHKEGDGTVAPWSKRVVAAAKLIRQADPDVVSIQEAAAWTGAPRGPRQIDSLVKQLGGEYSLADTEIPPSQPHYFRTGCYILYKTADFEAVGAGNHWGLGNQRWAAYQELQNRTSGARFLMVAPHLVVGDGMKFDKERRAETQSLLKQAGVLAAKDGVPVVYAGDFNSDPDKRHAFNAPALAMQSAQIDDAFDVAQSRTNAKYNSANEYFRRPIADGYHIDYVFAPAGVAVQSWKLIIDLRHGKFVGVIPSDHNPVMASLLISY